MQFQVQAYQTNRPAASRAVLSLRGAIFRAGMVASELTVRM